MEVYITIKRVLLVDLVLKNSRINEAVNKLRMSE